MNLSSNKEEAIEESIDHSEKEDFMSNHENSFNSSKEDPKFAMEKSDDSLDSNKEGIHIRIEEKSFDKPSRKEYRDIAIGMSDITLSGQESEEEENTTMKPSNRLIRPSPIPILPLPQPVSVLS